MRRYTQYALLLVVATTLRVIYEYEGQLRASSLAASLQPPRLLGCDVDDATFYAEAAKVKAGPPCSAVAAIASYWVDARKVSAAGASPLFASRIIDATADNHARRPDDKARADHVVDASRANMHVEIPIL